jgi:hypothetical protein
MNEVDLIEKAFPLEERNALSILHGCMVHLQERQRELAFYFESHPFDVMAWTEYATNKLSLFSLGRLECEVLDRFLRLI